MLSDGYRLDAIAFVLIGSGIEGIVEAHIVVEGIIAGAHFLLGDGVIQGRTHLGLVGEELTQFERGGNAVRLLGIGRTLHDALFETSETIAHIAPCKVECTEVGELDVHRSRCGPTAVVVGIHKAQLVDPHLTRLHIA